MTPLLRIEDLHVAYGALVALRGVFLTAQGGELVAVIGPNGAGKSTLLKTIIGLLRPQCGTIALDGRPLQGEPPQTIVTRGVALVPEGRQLFPSLTVEENIVLGAYRRLFPLGGIPRGGALDEVYELFPRLRERRRQLAGTLSGGEQQMVALARALVSRPRLLLCDEPSLGLAPLIVRQIFDVLRQLCARGAAVVLAEQYARLALDYADRAYVLHVGRVTLEGPTAALRGSEALWTAFIGQAPAVVGQDGQPGAGG